MTAVALTIAGSDSGGGAGIQADLKTFDAYGVWGTSAVTVVTAQNTLGVHHSVVLDPTMVVAQIEAVVGDFPLRAAKTGMLGTAAVVSAVAATLARVDVPVVVDPVLVSKHGALLLALDALDAVRTELLPLATLVTPNLAEAEALVGWGVKDRDGMVAAASALADFGPAAVLIKGGHLPVGEDAVDLLWVRGVETWLPGSRLPATHTHGTGCVLSAAICALLAKGVGLDVACLRAKQFVRRAITRGLAIGAGVGPVDPSPPTPDSAADEGKPEV